MRGEPVVRPVAPLLMLDESCVAEHLEVMADGGLAQSERPGQVALTGLAAGLRLDQAQEPQARRVSDDLQRGGEAICLVAVERGLEDGRARGGGLDRRDGLHGSILTDIYVNVQTPHR